MEKVYFRADTGQSNVERCIAAAVEKLMGKKIGDFLIVGILLPAALGTATSIEPLHHLQTTELDEKGMGSLTTPLAKQKHGKSHKDMYTNVKFKVYVKLRALRRTVTFAT